MTASSSIQRKHRLYAVLMLLALAWLTVSLPFVYSQQQAQKATVEKQVAGAPEEDNANPPTNPTEEKTENGVNTLNEYLHETHHAVCAGILLTTFYKGHSADLYVAFHPEYICPPPDVLLS